MKHLTPQLFNDKTEANERNSRVGLFTTVKSVQARHLRPSQPTTIVCEPAVSRCPARRDITVTLQ